MEAGLATVTAAALARHERYVREFVEGFNFCPYARRSRETGTLQRVVLLEETFDAAASAIAAAIERFERLPAESMEVGFIILPVLAPDLSKAPQKFEMLVRAAREKTEARHGSSATPFYCVAFHPDFAEDLADEHRAVRFLRRSPDPTVQLVRASVLEKVRSSSSVSDRIAAANLKTLKSEGLDAMRALLGAIRADR